MSTQTAAPIVNTHVNPTPRTVGHRDGIVRRVEVIDLHTRVDAHLFEATYYRDVEGGRLLAPCGKCGGTGILSHYLHVHDGLCYACDGTATAGRGYATVATAVRGLAKYAVKTAAAMDEEAARQAEAERVAAEAASEEAAAEAARKEAAAARSAYLGEPGDKITFTGTVRAAMTVDGYAYGTTQMFLIIADEEGNYTAKTYTAAGWAYGVRRGDVVTVTAIVKKHDTRDGEKVTVVKAPRLKS